jgi:hypothetical protein
MVIDIKEGHSETHFQDIHTALEKMVDTDITNDADHTAKRGNSK